MAEIRRFLGCGQAARDMPAGDGEELRAVAAQIAWPGRQPRPGDADELPAISAETAAKGKRVKQLEMAADRPCRERLVAGGDQRLRVLRKPDQNAAAGLD